MLNSYLAFIPADIMSLWTGLKMVVMVGICLLALHIIEDEEEGVVRQAAASYTYTLLIYFITIFKSLRQNFNREIVDIQY